LHRSGQGDSTLNSSNRAAAWIGMKLKRKLTWDAAKEAFVGDDEANAMRSRKSRKAEFDINTVMKKAGLA
jgi:hypothetical protein